MYALRQFISLHDMVLDGLKAFGADHVFNAAGVFRRRLPVQAQPEFLIKVFRIYLKKIEKNY